MLRLVEFSYLFTVREHVFSSVEERVKLSAKYNNNEKKSKKNRYSFRAICFLALLNLFHGVILNSIVKNYFKLCLFFNSLKNVLLVHKNTCLHLDYICEF